MLITYSGLIMPFFALGSAMLEEKNRTLPFPEDSTNQVRCRRCVQVHRTSPGRPGLGMRLSVDLPDRRALHRRDLARHSRHSSGAVRVHASDRSGIGDLLQATALPRRACPSLCFGEEGFLAGTALSSSSISADEALRAVLEAKPGQIAAAVAVVLALYFAAMLMAQAIFRRKEM